MKFTSLFEINIFLVISQPCDIMFSTFIKALINKWNDFLMTLFKLDGSLSIVFFPNDKHDLQCICYDFAKSYAFIL